MIWFSASCTMTSLPNSLGLFALPLANHLGVRLKYAEQLAVGLGVAAEHPLPCLAQDRLHPGNHLIPLLLGFVQYGQIALLDALAISCENFLACPATRLVISSSL